MQGLRICSVGIGVGILRQTSTNRINLCCTAFPSQRASFGIQKELDQSHIHHSQWAPLSRPQIWVFNWSCKAPVTREWCHGCQGLATPGLPSFRHSINDYFLSFGWCLWAFNSSCRLLLHPARSFRSLDTGAGVFCRGGEQGLSFPSFFHRINLQSRNPHRRQVQDK